MREPISRAFLRPLMLAGAGGCAALLAVACTPPHPGAAPSPAHLLASAVAALRSGRPCAVRGDVAVGATEGNYDVVNSVSAGDRFRATVIQHLASAHPFEVAAQFIDDGAALYLRSADALRLAYNGKVPTGLAGRWVRFPSWQSLSQRAYKAEYSKLSQYPGLGGDALFHLMLDSVSMPSQGGSCPLLIATLRAQVGAVSHAVPGILAGRPVFTFTMSHVFSALSTQRYQITVSRGTPVSVLRVTSGKQILSFSYPARIAPISAPPAAKVILAPEIPGLSRIRH